MKVHLTRRLLLDKGGKGVWKKPSLFGYWIGWKLFEWWNATVVDAEPKKCRTWGDSRSWREHGFRRPEEEGYVSSSMFSFRFVETCFDSESRKNMIATSTAWSIIYYEVCNSRRKFGWKSPISNNRVGGKSITRFFDEPFPIGNQRHSVTQFITMGSNRQTKSRRSSRGTQLPRLNFNRAGREYSHDMNKWVRFCDLNPSRVPQGVVKILFQTRFVSSTSDPPACPAQGLVWEEIREDLDPEREQLNVFSEMCVCALWYIYRPANVERLGQTGYKRIMLYDQVFYGSSFIYVVFNNFEKKAIILDQRFTTISTLPLLGIVVSSVRIWMHIFVICNFINVINYSRPPT